jgi:predicted ATPase/transcriptional regulator with XRE-family HTH domain
MMADDAQADERTLSFGAWIARRRRALHLTQRELAARVACSYELIHKIEADARRPSRDIATHLARQLGLDSATADLFVRVARSEIAADHLPSPEHLEPTSTAPLRATLPMPATSLIGRERDVAALKTALLQPHVRLLTITGPAGVGKTRLALQVAAEMAPRFADGACVVLLAPVSDASLVAPALLHALGAPQRHDHPALDIMQEALRERELLLVLDNFEHLLGAARLVGTLVSTAPRLTVLTTSRERLNLSDEHIYRVAPLEVPLPDTSPEQLAANPAVRLFIERARAVGQEFALSANTAAAITELCVLLEGLPLAIELAAARCRTFTPAALLARLRERHSARLVLLRGGARDLADHQRALVETLDWSFRLLAPAEQRFFERMAVFAGGWDLEAAAALWDGPEDALDLLTALVDKSLVVAEIREDGANRFSMLETTRAYALERLTERDELEHAHEQRIRYFLALAEYTERTYHTPHQRAALLRLDTERDNLLAALSWSLGDTHKRPEYLALGVRLTAALVSCWFNNRPTTESRIWIERALRYKDVDAVAYVKLLLNASRLRSEIGDTTQALTLAQQALELMHNQEDDQGIAWALESLGRRERRRGNMSQARIYLERSSDIFRRSSQMHGLGYALQALGTVARETGDTERAEAYFREALAIFRTQQATDGLVFVLYGVGDTACDRGDWSSAERFYAEALIQAQSINDLLATGWAQSNLGDLARLRGQLDIAQQHLEQALVELRKIDHRFGINWALMRLGNVMRLRGDNHSARHLLLEALPWMLEDGAQSATMCLEALAAVAVRERAQPHGAQRAVRLLSIAGTLRDASGVAVWPCYRADYDGTFAVARATLGEEGFAKAWAEGQALPREQGAVAVLQYAVEIDGLEALP